jgi:nicotinamide riboside transporter PnuC
MISGLMCLVARRRMNYRGAVLGMIVMTYYLVVNLNPFMRESGKLLTYMLQDLFIEYFAILGVFFMIIANSTKERAEVQDPREVFQMQRMKQ